MSETNASRSLEQIRALLRRPTRLGIVLNGLLLAAWYGASYTPMQEAIDEDLRRIATERERLALAAEVEQLRGLAGRYGGLLPRTDEGDAWIPFLMAGVRRYPIKLISLEPRPPVTVGPYKAAVHRVVVEGTYPDLGEFLRWLEGSPRLIRVDSIRVVSRAQQGGGMGGGMGGNSGLGINEMQLMLIGVEG